MSRSFVKTSDFFFGLLNVCSDTTYQQQTVVFAFDFTERYGLFLNINFNVLDFIANRPNSVLYITYFFFFFFYQEMCVCVCVCCVLFMFVSS